MTIQEKLKKISVKAGNITVPAILKNLSKDILTHPKVNWGSNSAYNYINFNKLGINKLAGCRLLSFKKIMFFLEEQDRVLYPDESYFDYYLTINYNCDFKDKILDSYLKEYKWEIDAKQILYVLSDFYVPIQLIQTSPITETRRYGEEWK